MVIENQILAFLPSIGPTELVVIGLIALLIFGRRLPEVGRSLGKSFVEFKKGLKDTSNELKDIKSDVEKSGNDDSFKKGLKDTSNELKDIKSDVEKSGSDASSSDDSPTSFNAPKNHNSN
jgi:TatA/E family protein of Tat protein translocase